MNEITLSAMNCQDLANYRNRKDVLSYIRVYEYKIFCLQDIHITKNTANLMWTRNSSSKLKHPYWNWALFCCRSTKMKWSPIEHASRDLKDAGTRYSTTELECLAIVWGHIWIQNLYRNKLTIQRDYKSLLSCTQQNWRTLGWRGGPWSINRSGSVSKLSVEETTPEQISSAVACRRRNRASNAIVSWHFEVAELLVYNHVLAIPC